MMCVPNVRLNLSDTSSIKYIFWCSLLLSFSFIQFSDMIDSVFYLARLTIIIYQIQED